MNKTLMAVIIGIFILGAAGFFALAYKNDNRDTSKNSTSHSEPASSMPNSSSNNNQNQPTGNQEALEGEVQVNMSDFAFTPADLKVKKGTTVTWTNQDEAEHDIAPDDESQDFKKSELLSKGQSYSYTFNSVGTFAYHCTPHPYMKASVEVVE